MGDPHGITDQSPVDIDKAAKWTIFLLVDLRVVFIITYVYVSVVNLISTTANGEASEDVHSTKLFNVTSLLEHTDVNVSFIDDAILWNCRDYSVTKHYYRGLYSMLISAFSGTMIAFIFTKIAIICGAKHDYLYLWRLAIIECLQQQMRLGKSINKEPGEMIAIYKEAKKLVGEKDPLDKVYNSKNIDDWDIKCLKRYNFCRVARLHLSVVVLVIAIVFTFLFYDLHPLSCIHGRREKYFDYDETTESVKIQFSHGILVTQMVVGAILPVLALVFVNNALAFYYCNIHVINIFVEHVKQEFRNSKDITACGENSYCKDCCRKCCEKCPCKDCCEKCPCKDCCEKCHCEECCEDFCEHICRLKQCFSFFMRK